MQIEVGILFSTGIALLGVYATVNKINSENKKQTSDREREILAEKEKQTERHIELKISLENLGLTMHQVAMDMRSMDNKFEQLDRRVVVVEESSKSAHKRIDTIEQKCDKRYERA